MVRIVLVILLLGIIVNICCKVVDYVHDYKDANKNIVTVSVSDQYSNALKAKSSAALPFLDSHLQFLKNYAATNTIALEDFKVGYAKFNMFSQDKVLPKYTATKIYIKDNDEIVFHTPESQDHRFDAEFLEFFFNGNHVFIIAPCSAIAPLRVAGKKQPQAIYYADVHSKEVFTFSSSALVIGKTYETMKLSDGAWLEVFADDKKQIVVKFHLKQRQ